MYNIMNMYPLALAGCLFINRHISCYVHYFLSFNIITIITACFETSVRLFLAPLLDYLQFASFVLTI